MECALAISGVTLGLLLPKWVKSSLQNGQDDTVEAEKEWNTRPQQRSRRTSTRLEEDTRIPAGRARRSNRAKLPEARWEEEMSDFDDDFPAERARRRAPRGPMPSKQVEVFSESSNFASVAGWEGFSMEDAMQHAAQINKAAKELTPAEVLKNLQRGNARFWTGCATRPEKSAFERRALIMQQFPQVAILGCSDSRVPIEVVFDQGLGDVFVVRVAGNCLDTGTTASLQYAVRQLKVKVLMVMGHEGCGAVKAAARSPEELNKEPKALGGLLRILKSGLDEQRLANVHDSRAHDREAVVTNVRRQIEQLCKDKSIMAKVASKELLVVGGFYEISSGIVDFFMEVAEADPSTPKPRILKSGVTEGVQSTIEFKSQANGDGSSVQLPSKEFIPAMPHLELPLPNEDRKIEAEKLQQSAAGEAGKMLRQISPRESGGSVKMYSAKPAPPQFGTTYMQPGVPMRYSLGKKSP